MTKSRISTGRVLLGVLGKSPHSSATLKEWNEYLRENGIDGSMDRYPCTKETLQERLSEMVHFDRRGYVVAPALQQQITVLMDVIDASARKKKIVDTVVNDQGILTGHFCGTDEVRKRLWL